MAHERQNAFSTSELAQNVETARAPEPNSVAAAIAFDFVEFDPASSAPEASENESQR